MAEIGVRFISDSGATVVFSTKAIAAIVDATKRKPDCETGGILIGHYSDDLTCAWIDDATGEPPGSQSGRTWFLRGQRGLRKVLATFWRDGRYYVGEWHSHPHSSPTPSAPDLSSLRNISRSKKFTCERPILAVIGGDILNIPLLSVTIAAPNGKVEIMRSYTNAE